MITLIAILAIQQSYTFTTFVPLAPAINPSSFSARSDLPTVAEAALPGYESTSWRGVFAPTGTPRDVVDIAKYAKIVRESVTKVE
jgi:tripartite-type tricarboxylate transporter receptor subunit TctC